MKHKHLIQYITYTIIIACTIGIGHQISTSTTSNQTYNYHSPQAWDDINTPNTHQASSTDYDKIQDFEILEHKFHPHKDIIKNNSYNLILSQLIKQCTTGSISHGLQLFENKRTAIRNHYKPDDLVLGVRLLLSYEVFTELNISQDIRTNRTREEYCSKKYASLVYQDRISLIHKDHLINLGLVSEFSNQQSNEIYAESEKKDFVGYITDRDNVYIESILGKEGINNDFSFKISNTSTRNKAESTIQEPLIELSKTKITKSLAMLYELNILSLDEIKKISQNTSFKIVSECDRSAKYIIEHNNQDHTKSYSLEFNIGACHLYESLIGSSIEIEHIMLHELAHYIQTNKDKDTDTYFQICWENDNNNCAKESFISEYSSVNKYEDYAEHFAATVIKTMYGYSPKGEINEKKYQYMKNLIQELGGMNIRNYEPKRTISSIPTSAKTFNYIDSIKNVIISDI